MLRMYRAFSKIDFSRYISLFAVARAVEKRKWKVSQRSLYFAEILLWCARLSSADSRMILLICFIALWYRFQHGIQNWLRTILNMGYYPTQYHMIERFQWTRDWMCRSLYLICWQMEENRNHITQSTYRYGIGSNSTCFQSSTINFMILSNQTETNDTKNEIYRCYVRTLYTVCMQLTYFNKLHSKNNKNIHRFSLTIKNWFLIPKTFPNNFISK